MKNALLFSFWLIVAMVTLFLAIVLGELGAWYFSWVLGTSMIVLVAVAGTVMLDAREDHPSGQSAEVRKT